MDYTIGNLSSLLDLSVEGIRNYEKQGIIESVRTDSAYRKYQYLDITSLVRARVYRSMGFSLKEISSMTNDLSPEEITARIREKQSELENENRMLKSQVELLSTWAESLENIEQRLDRAVLTTSRGYYRMEFSKNGEVDLNAKTTRHFREWMNYLPFVHVSTRYHGEDMFGGLAIEDRYARLFGIAGNPYVSYCPPALTISLLVRENDNGFSQKKCTDRIAEFAEYHRLIPAGDPIGHTILGIHKRTDYVRYRAIYVPVLAE